MKISAEEEYSKTLLDKRVLLVAPSEAAFQTEDEELRSRFDVIARIGHGYRHNLRTDILFHALKGNQGNGVREVDVDEAYNVGVKYLLYPRFIRGRIRKLKARNSKFKTMIPKMIPKMIRNNDSRFQTIIQDFKQKDYKQ